MIYLDTHAVMAAYQNDFGAFSTKALQTIESDDDIRVSPMVLLELEFLREIKRIRPTARHITDALADVIGLRVCDLPFAAVVRKAVEERWTRDPFDRLIVAHARFAQAALITKDRRIHAHYADSVG